MAVLIKNFDMPHDCNVCPIHKIENVNQYVEYIVCKATGKKLNKDFYYRFRDLDCPLEYIPDASDTTFSTTGKPRVCNMCKFKECPASELPCCNCRWTVIAADYFEAGNYFVKLLEGSNENR